MASEFTIKQSDTSRPVKVTLSTDLTGALVNFRMSDSAGALAINEPATIITPSVVIDGVISGVVQYDWQTGDTDTPGRYYAEFVVTYFGGRIETFPADGYLYIVIGDGIPLEEDTDTFQIDTTGAELLCSDQMIRDLLDEVTEFPGSIYDASNKLAEMKVQSRAFLQFYSGKIIGYRDIVGEKLDGNDRKFITPIHTPILGVTSLSVDDEPLVFETDYWVYPDRVETLAHMYAGHGNVSISYRAGLGLMTDLYTAMIVAQTCAIFIAGAVASGPSQSSGIQAGPVALRESFFIGGRYLTKYSRMRDDIWGWIMSRRGARMMAVGRRPTLPTTPRIYVPRIDRFE
jgi:hypothetical protein